MRSTRARLIVASRIDATGRAFTSAATSASWRLRDVTLALLRCDMGTDAKRSGYGVSTNIFTTLHEGQFRQIPCRFGHKRLDGWTAKRPKRAKIGQIFTRMCRRNVWLGLLVASRCGQSCLKGKSSWMALLPLQNGFSSAERRPPPCPLPRFAIGGEGFVREASFERFSTRSSTPSPPSGAWGRGSG